MGKSMGVTDWGHGPTPGPATAEAAALKWFVERTMGAYAGRLPIERWRPDQRKRFEDELARLERKSEKDHRDRLQQLEAESS